MTRTWASQLRELPTQLPEGVGAEAAARWLIERRDGTMLKDGPALDRALQGLADGERHQLVCVAHALAATWARQWRERLRCDEGADRLARTVRAVASVVVVYRHATAINEMDYDADLRSPWFPYGAAGRLLRGVTNCDGVGHLLSLLLSNDRPMLTAIDSHRLVTVSVDGVQVFLDAHLPAPPFCLSERVPAGVLSRTDVAAQFRAKVGNPDGIRSARVYADAWPTAQLPSQVEVPWPRDVEAPQPPSQRQPESPWDTYLVGRLAHLFGSFDDAAERYAQVAATRGAQTGLDELAVQASSALLELLRAPPDTPFHVLASGRPR